MNDREKIRLFKEVFAPQPGETVLFLLDQPHNRVKDDASWQEARKMGMEWYQLFQQLGKKEGFSVNLMTFESSGIHNAPISKEIHETASNATLVLAIIRYSISSSLIKICFANGSKTRAAGMMLERIMENTAFKANYTKIRHDAKMIARLLSNAIGAEITFSTEDTLYIDLRNRTGIPDTGECTKTGQYINFPSGEGFIAPYEAGIEEVTEFGESKTNGIWPVQYDKELVKFIVHRNKITRVLGDGKKAKEMRQYFREKASRANVAELGIGCNPQAVITGNIALDEKVGLHIAYGMSSHFGGTVESDVHRDIVYAQGCPIKGKTVTLINEDRATIDLIQHSQLRYDLLQ